MKKWFLYILLWRHSQSYGTWLIYPARTSDTSYYWVFFFTFSHFHEYGLRHFDSLKYPGFLPIQADLIFFKNYFPVDRWTQNGNIFDDRLILPLILPSTIFIALSLFLNHDRCLFILRSERDWCVSSCSECFQYWVRFGGNHSIELHRKLVGWFLYGIYKFYLVYFRWIVSVP